MKNKHTSGKWFIKNIDGKILIDSDENLTKYPIAEVIQMPSFFEENKAQEQYNAEIICNAVNTHEKLVKVLQDIINDWDDKMGVRKGYPKEIYRESEIHGEPFNYWSPAASMVSTEYIAAARELINKVTDNMPAEV